MRLTFGLDKLGPAPAGRAVTVGSFDGVHLGHQQIIGQVTAAAQADGLLATVVSFEPHPLAVLRPDAAPLQLSTVDEKAELMAALGVDELVVLPFTAALAAMEPVHFAEHVLADALQAKYVCEGWNFRFGKGGAGTPQLLAEIGPRLGFTAAVVEPVEVDGVVVSSTVVRDWLARGDAEGVWRMLGRPYYVSGVITRGDGRGRQLGFPTANVDVPPRRALPAAGVYAVAVRSDANGPWLPGMANLGRRPTFGGDELRLEVHLLEGGRDMYGETLTVAFLQRLRAEQKFSGVDTLVAQLTDDRQQTEAVWAERSRWLGGVYSPLPM